MIAECWTPAAKPSSLPLPSSPQFYKKITNQTPFISLRRTTFPSLHFIISFFSHSHTPLSLTLLLGEWWRRVRWRWGGGRGGGGGQQKERGERRGRPPFKDRGMKHFILIWYKCCRRFLRDLQREREREERGLAAMGMWTSDDYEPGKYDLSVGDDIRYHLFLVRIRNDLV